MKKLAIGVAAGLVFGTLFFAHGTGGWNGDHVMSRGNGGHKIDQDNGAHMGAG